MGHVQDVANSFRELFGDAGGLTRLGMQWLKFFKMDSQRHAEFFVRHGLAACIWHDAGKANSGFQEALLGSGIQVIRHEHLSGLFFWLPEIRDWMSNQLRLDVNLVACGVMGHHFKADRGTIATKLDADRNSFSVDPRGVNDLLRLLAQELGVESPPAFQIGRTWSFNGVGGTVDVEQIRERLLQELRRYGQALERDENRRRLMMAIRAALILADGAGSGLTREGKNLSEWIRGAFDDSCLLDGEAIENRVVAPRIEQIRNDKGAFYWSDFQVASEKLPERALLLAPCGSGKTLAAWRWIKARAAERPMARAIFLYPTRATASEGFRDYVSWAPEADAALIHATSVFDLQGMFENPGDDRGKKDFTTEDRLFALAYWQRRIFSATVDQFLGFMQYSYRSVCLLPLLADSVIVVDEVHSFDKSLFSALKRFLKEFDVPILCMTASLPPKRVRDLEECGLTVFPKDTQQFKDLQALAEMPRYKVRRIGDENDASRIAATAVDARKKVLWVVNTVARCQSLARKLDASCYCYHSRFRLEDRKNRHDEVMSAFRRESPPVLAVTTQVCEMSLDLDADVLISEEAPITALIQRMGRCNRFTKPGSSKIGEVYTYKSEQSRPYKDEELVGVEHFLRALDGQVVGQSRLQELLEEYGPQDVEAEKYAAFLESGPWAVSREEPLREGDEFTVPAVLNNGDVGYFLELRKRRLPTDGLLVPVPRRFARPDTRLGSWPLTADAAHYSSQFGFMNEPVDVKP